MSEKDLSFDEMIAQTRVRVLEAALPEVIFDGWSDEVFQVSVKNAGVPADNAALAFPRGLKDLVIYFHRSGNQKLEERAPALPSGITAKVHALVLARLEIAAPHKEAVRKAASYFALPQNMPTGTSLIWETCDLIWDLAGVHDKGFSHYSRRASLATIYSTTLLYWLQDESADMSATAEFLSRRLDNLGQFHKTKARFTKPFSRSVR